MPTIAIYVTWKGLGFYVLLYLAALQNVPKELYEAAAIDGAGRWASFRSVTWPGVRPATTLVLVLAIITGSNLFTEPYLLTGGGGPNGASSSPVLIMYQTGIEQGDAGAAAAIGVILVIFVAIVGLIARPSVNGTVSGRPTWWWTRRNSENRAAAASTRAARLVLLTVAPSCSSSRSTTCSSGRSRRSPTPASRRPAGPGNLTTTNYSDINGHRPGRLAGQLGDLHRSGLLSTLVLRAARRLRPGRPALPRARRAFASVLLVQTIPFQLLMIPLYVLLVRDYGLGDTYLGMILPFAISATAVFIFRQFFLQLPVELFDAARIDGASESSPSSGASPSRSPARRSSRRPCSRSSAPGTSSCGRSSITKERRHAAARRVARQLPSPTSHRGRPTRSAPSSPGRACWRRR